MEGFDDYISSTTPSNDELLRGSGDTNKLFEDAAGFLLESPKESAASEPLDEDDILDLAGGARDAIERHKAAVSRFEDDEPMYTKYTEPVTSDPDPEADQGLLGGFVDSTEKQAKPVSEIAETEAPKAGPTNPTKEPSSTETSSYESFFSSSAASQSLMQSSAEGRVQPLGRAAGDGSHHAPVSPISPLHSPDSLEELSLSDSPNQAPFTSVPFGSGPVPHTEAFSQKLVQDVPLGEEGGMFECKTWADNLNVKSGLHYREASRGPNREGLEAASYSPLESGSFSSSAHTAGLDLGSKMDQAKSMLCDDSGVASSPDEKLGSSVGSQEDGRMDSGFDKVSGSGESTGSTPTRSPLNQNLTAEPYSAYASSNPTVKSETTYLDSQDNIKGSDTSSTSLFSSKTSWYESEMLPGTADPEDDSFLLEMKSSSTTKNPFQGFSPISHSGGGFSQYGEIGSDSRAVKMSESPTPDLVQYAHDELQEAMPAKHMEETHFDLVHKGSDSVMEPSKPSVPSLSVSPKDPEDSPAQPSLPDILESSPLSSGKQDSDLSEGSPDSDQSPVQTIRRQIKHVPVTHSATNPFAFDSDAKISALKDKTAETGAKGAEMAGHAILPGLDQTFGAFDLVKEVDRHESVPYMNLQTSVASKAAPEEYDSDSPNTDSLSPVLTKNPPSFQVQESPVPQTKQTEQTKQTKDFLGGKMFMDEPEASEEEGFEQEVSSEEFEIIERPPKGSVDEFVEKLDHSKFTAASDMGADEDEDDEDALSNFSQVKAVPDIESVFQKPDSHRSSYTLLSQPAAAAAPDVFGAELGNPFAPARPGKEAASLSQAHLTEEAPKMAAPSQAKGEKMEALPDASAATGLPGLGVEAGKRSMGVLHFVSAHGHPPFCFGT